MIEPYEFYSNEETHSSNHYQDRVIESISIETITKNAIKEFTTLKKQIEDRGIKVTSFKKRCINTDCKVIKMREDFNKKILDEIFKKVTLLNIQKETD